MAFTIELLQVENCKKTDVARDVADINKLLRQLSPVLAADVTLEHLIKTLKSGWVCVARERGAIIGMASLLRLDKLAGYMGTIEDVVVLKECRGQGIARAIMEKLHDIALEERMVSIALTSSPYRSSARALYHSLGYTERDTSVFRFVP